MNQIESAVARKYGEASIEVYQSGEELGAAAADRAAREIDAAIAERGTARLFVATGNSQIRFIEALVRIPLAWDKTEVFHLDEYVGLPATHPSSFRYWIRTRFEEKVHPGSIHYVAGDAPDLESELVRYANLIKKAPIDVAFIGIGENGHIAFNDPPVADFDDPAVIKKVLLDEACRQQQSGEGHFATLQDVPREALTVTCSTLLRVKTWICCVPEARKAKAVRDSLEGPITTACPGSIIRRHPRATVYLDRESASLLKEI